MSNLKPIPLGALTGIRVLDLSRVLAAPWATQILGDLGAEVIKVESPTKRDDTRTWGPPFIEGGSEPWDAAYYFCANRNKKAIAVDFSRAEGADLIRRLAAKADVVVENFKVGTLAKYGLDYAMLSAINPRLIYCSVTGFGHSGPYAKKGGYDFLVQGMSGLMSIIGAPAGEPHSSPMKVGIPISDLTCGLYACISILAALQHRNATGEGQQIDCALLDCQIALLSNQAANYFASGVRPKRLGNAHPNVVPYRDFATKDDFLLVACGNDRQFLSLCELLGRDDLAADPRYRSNAGRNLHRRELELALALTIATWSAADLLQAMADHGVPGGPINSIDQVFADPQVEARGLVQTLDRKDGAHIRTVGFPVKLSKTPASYRSAPPQFAQDTDEVLKDALELTANEIEALHANGTVRGAAPVEKPVAA